MSDEPKRDIEISRGKGSVSFDGTFVTIVRDGLAALSIGRSTKRIPVASITAVQWRSASTWSVGFIQFTLAGGNEVRSRPGHQVRDAARDENSLVFDRKSMPQYEALRAAVEAAMAERGGVAPAAASDVIGQLEQLGALRDSGVLTPEEFDAKKGELLARL